MSALPITETEDREDEIRVLKVQGSQLLSLTEGARICEGFQLQGCGDEIDDPNSDICPNCKREEDKFYADRALEQDRVEAELSGSQYFHLKK